MALRHGFKAEFTFDLSDSQAVNRRRERVLVSLSFEVKDIELQKRIDYVMRHSFMSTFLTNLNLRMQDGVANVPVRGKLVTGFTNPSFYER